MMYAYCVGDNKDLCENPPPALGCPGDAATFKCTLLQSFLIFDLSVIVMNEFRLRWLFRLKVDIVLV